MAKVACGEKVIRCLLAISRVGVGGLFVRAGALKAVNPSQFLGDIESYGLLPYQAAVGMALYLPWLEILCGMATVVKRLHIGAMTVLCVLTSLFTVAIISAWTRGLDISCGCFADHGGKPNFPELVFRDLAILVLLIGLMASEYRANKLVLPDFPWVIPLKH